MGEMTQFQKIVVGLLIFIALVACFNTYQLYEIKMNSGYGISRYQLEFELKPIIRELESISRRIR